MQLRRLFEPCDQARLDPDNALTLANNALTGRRPNTQAWMDPAEDYNLESLYIIVLLIFEPEILRSFVQRS